jgi:hypothetical protein
MLTIENLKKIQGRSTAGNWVVKECGVLTHNDSYYFGLYQIKAGVGAVDRCNIMLERKAIPHRSYIRRNELAYFFICDSKRTSYCGTADWLADIDNVLGVMEELIELEHIKL